MTVGDLNLTDEKPPARMDRRTFRRLRLAKSIRRQIAFAQREANGERIAERRWYWQSNDGSYRAAVKFGRQLLALSKGKYSAKANSLNEVLEIYEKLAKAADASHFDAQLDEAAASIRKQFASKTALRKGDQSK